MRELSIQKAYSSENCMVNMKWAIKFSPWQYPTYGFLLEKAIRTFSKDFSSASLV
jgi:hypothetical protein